MDENRRTIQLKPKQAWQSKRCLKSCNKVQRIMSIRQPTSRAWSATPVDWNDNQILRRNISRDSCRQTNDSANVTVNNCIQSQQWQNTTTSTWTILPNGWSSRKRYWSHQPVTASSVTTRFRTGEMDEQKRWSFRRTSRRIEVHQQNLASWNSTLLAVIFTASGDH